MKEETGAKQSSENKQAVEHLSEAHSLLENLREELSQHPQLEDAIRRVEMALSLLTAKSGGML